MKLSIVEEQLRRAAAKVEVAKPAPQAERLVPPAPAHHSFPQTPSRYMSNYCYRGGTDLESIAHWRCQMDDYCQCDCHLTQWTAH